MRTRMLYSIAIAIVLAVPQLAIPQEDTNGKVAEVKSRVDQIANPVPKRFYRLNYRLREGDEGKLVNQRAFVITINPERTNAEGEATGDPKWWSMRAGTKVPYAAGGSEASKAYSYADVGVNIDSRGYEIGDAFQLEVSTEITSLGTAESASAFEPPVIRQLKVRSAVLAPFGKPSTVFTAYDPASRHRFELEVTPVREK